MLISFSKTRFRMDRLISAMGLHALIAMRPLVHKIIFSAGAPPGWCPSPIRDCVSHSSLPELDSALDLARAGEQGGAVVEHLAGPRLEHLGRES